VKELLAKNKMTDEERKRMIMKKVISCGSNAETAFLFNTCLLLQITIKKRRSKRTEGEKKEPLFIWN